jgi:hypothetical protein
MHRFGSDKAVYVGACPGLSYLVRAGRRSGIRRPAATAPPRCRLRELLRGSSSFSISTEEGAFPRGSGNAVADPSGLQRHHLARMTKQARTIRPRRR